MKSIYTYTVLAIVAVLLAACSSEQYTVTGTSAFSTLDGNIAYMKRMDGSDYAKVDSCEVLHGNFHMTGPLDSVMCVWIFMGEGYGPDNRPIPVVLEQGNVRVNINSSVRAEGTPLNDRLYRFLSAVDSVCMLGTDLPRAEVQMYLEGRPETEIVSRLTQMQEDNARLLMELDRMESKFIRDNFDNVLGVTWFMRLCNQAFIDNGYPTTTPQIDAIYNAAPPSFRSNPTIHAYMQMCK